MCEFSFTGWLATSFAAFLLGLLWGVLLVKGVKRPSPPSPE